ncbi:MAG: GntR family transcriptional regulator [Chloroflexi bacterium]|nr:GntR family transcriptional regulator [Chloroflexota bacterium]
MRLKYDSRPLYLQAEEALNRLIQDGTYRVGDRLPPEPELAQRLGISRATLREALRAFEDKGLITRRRGLGTFINAPAPLIDSGLEQLESLDSLARRMGLVCTTEDLEIREEPATPELASRLGIAAGDKVITVGRTKVTNGVIAAYMYDVLPAWVTDVATLRASFKGSVLDYLLERGVPLSFAWTNIIATRADSSVAAKLHVKPSTVLLLLEEVSYTQENQIVGYSQNYFLPTVFKFHLIRRIAPSR